MKFLALLNKEQWAAAGAVLAGLLYVMGALVGGKVSKTVIPPLTERAWERAPARFQELPAEDFRLYWQDGENLFPPETTSKLPLPLLPAPEPREEDLPAPLFRPGPSSEAYNQMALKGRYLPLRAKAFAVTEAEAPPAAEIEALRKIEEPVGLARPDRRAERIREFFTVHTKVPGSAPQMGAFVHETADEVIMRGRNGQIIRLKREDIKAVAYNWTHLEQYERDTRAVAAGPQEAMERLKLARRLTDLGMIPEAKKELARALELKKDLVEAILLLAGLLFDESEYEGAMAYCDAGLATDVAAPELHFELARNLRALGLLEGAATALERAVDASPRFRKARVALARTHLDLGQPAAALETAGDFIARLGSDRESTPEQKAEAHLVRALAHLQLGDLARAKTELAEVMKLDPQNAEGLNAGGVIYALDGNFRSAGAEFGKAIRGNQYLTDAWTNLGALLMLAGRWADAEAIYAAAAQRDPASAEALHGEGLAQALGGKAVEGIAFLGKAADLDPRHAAARCARGMLRLKEGLFDEALLDLSESLRADWHYAPAYHAGGLAYLRIAAKIAEPQEPRLKAVTLFKSAKNIDESLPGPWTSLGCAYAVMGRAEDARQALRQAASILQAQGKSDPLVFYAKGFLEYWFAEAESEEARVGVAFGEFDRGAKVEAAGDPVGQKAAADCRKALEEIDVWRDRSLRLDETFTRDNAPDVGGGWIESDRKYNVAVTLEGGRARFSGRQSIADMGITTMERPIHAENFEMVEITFFPEKFERTEFGLSLYYMQAGQQRSGFHVGMDTNGKMRFTGMRPEQDMDRKDMNDPGWTEIKTPLPDPKRITLRIVKGEKNRVSTLSVHYLDAAKNEWIEAQKDVGIAGGVARGTWSISVFTRAWKEKEVGIAVDDIRVYERDRR